MVQYAKQGPNLNFSKICIVANEADESEYWLEIIDEDKLSYDREELLRFAKESKGITKIMSNPDSYPGKNSSYMNNQ